MDITLGAIPLSADILKQSNIGLWAFELDEGSEPRMYVDDAMLKLIGLKEQVSPEKTYHAWYDNIDPAHYDEVHASVAKMQEGIHSEVQYPWHAPDGTIMIVRCEGVRNYAYKKGIRIEGVHRDVTDLVHFEKTREEELLRNSRQLEHEKLRTDALTFLAEYEPEPIEFINFFADRLLSLSGCDQVIYRSVSGRKIQKNAEGVKNTPDSVCKECPYADPKNAVYKEEILEIPDFKKAAVSCAAKCPCKSAYYNIVKLNGEVQGVLALQYINKSFQISEPGRKTLNMFGQMLSLALSNINASQSRMQYINDRYTNATKIIDTFCKKYATVYFVDLKTDIYKNIKNDPVMAEHYSDGKSFSKGLKRYIQVEVFEQDRRQLLAEVDYNNIRKKLKEKGIFDVVFRVVIEGMPTWHRLTFSSMGTGDEILVGLVEANSEILLDHVEKIIHDDYYGIYIVDLNHDLVRSVKSTKSYTRPIEDECYSKVFMQFTDGLRDEDVEFFSKLVNPRFLKQSLANEDKQIYTYYSTRRKAWTQFTLFVLSRDEKGVPQVLAQCFSDVDSLQKKNLELSKSLQKQIEVSKEYESQMEESLAFTNLFLDTYKSAYYVDFSDCSYRIYKQGSEVTKEIKALNNYYKEIACFAERRVRQEDRQRLLDLIKPENLCETLKKEKGISFVFTDISQDKPMRIRFQAIRGADRQHAAIGFSDITAEMEEEQSYTNTVMSLSENFQAIYDVDINSGSYTLYSAGNEFAEVARTRFVTNTDFFEDNVKNIEAVIYKDDRPFMLKTFTRESIKNIIKSNKALSFEYRIVIHGEPKWYRCRIVKSQQEKNHFLVGLFDVDKERAKEKETQEIVNSLASEYSVLFHVNAETGEYKNVDLKGNNELKKNIRMFPKFNELIYSFANNETFLEGKDLILNYSDLEYIKKILAHKKSDHIYFSYKSGKDYRWYEQTIVKVQDENEPLEEFITYIVDRDSEIRDEQENKRQLQEALSMAQSANRAKTTFLNNMSHDIRTPMNAIIGYTGLAASHIDNKEHVQDYLQKIAQSSDHLLSLINDVLDMSRIESGKMNLEEKPENLSEIIHTLRNIVQADVHSRQLDFFIDSCDVNDEDIVCDKLRVNQVLLNILSNAIKYTSPGGTVSMRIKENAVRKNGYASYEFIIKDSGIGMTPEFLKTIFDPFTRMKSSTVSGIQGTGLGMAITKNIINMIGGTIDIQSELNKGTEVKINFDFKLLKSAKTPTKIAELVNLKGLVVDDDTNTCASITSMLKDIGMRGEWCTSGKEAIFRAGLAYREGEPFKVFIIDWLMPDMNGIETARRIRGVIGEEVPIIILTAYDWSDIEEEAREAGVTGFVSKPMFPSDLHRALNKCLGKETPLDKESIAKEKEFRVLENKRVLLVDDNEYNREIAMEILEDAKMIVTPVDDGSKALNVMKNAIPGDFDIVLMDIQMPVMNGYEATKKIRALGTEVSKIPILAMTANAFAEDLQLAIESGMNDHITKPITVDILKKILTKYV